MLQADTFVEEEGTPEVFEQTKDGDNKTDSNNRDLNSEDIYEFKR